MNPTTHRILSGDIAQGADCSGQGRGTSLVATLTGDTKTITACAAELTRLCVQMALPTPSANGAETTGLLNVPRIG